MWAVLRASRAQSSRGERREVPSSRQESYLERWVWFALLEERAWPSFVRVGACDDPPAACARASGRSPRVILRLLPTAGCYRGFGEGLKGARKKSEAVRTLAAPNTAPEQPCVFRSIPLAMYVCHFHDKARALT